MNNKKLGQSLCICRLTCVQNVHRQNAHMLELHTPLVHGCIDNVSIVQCCAKQLAGAVRKYNNDMKWQHSGKVTELK